MSNVSAQATTPAPQTALQKAELQVRTDLSAVRKDLTAATPDFGKIETDRLALDKDYKSLMVTQLYSELLGRDPDPTGLATYVGWMNQGKTVADVRAAIVASPEFQGRSGPLLNKDEQGVQDAYQACIKANWSLEAETAYLQATRKTAEDYKTLNPTSDRLPLMKNLEKAIVTDLSNQAKSAVDTAYQSTATSGWTLTNEKSLDSVVTKAIAAYTAIDANDPHIAPLQRFQAALKARIQFDEAGAGI